MSHTSRNARLLHYPCRLPSSCVVELAARHGCVVLSLELCEPCCLPGAQSLLTSTSTEREVASVLADLTLKWVHASIAPVQLSDGSVVSCQVGLLFVPLQEGSWCSCALIVTMNGICLGLATSWYVEYILNVCTVSKWKYVNVCTQTLGRSNLRPRVIHGVHARVKPTLLCARSETEKEQESRINTGSENQTSHTSWYLLPTSIMVPTRLQNPIQSNPIQSNPIQSNPIQSNPIQSKSHSPHPSWYLRVCKTQSNPIQSNPIQSNLIQESIPTSTMVPKRLQNALCKGWDALCAPMCW